MDVAAAELLTEERRSSAHHTGGMEPEAEQTPVKSAQINLAFPGVTVTQIDPQDAGSSVTVIDLYGSIGEQGSCQSPSDSSNFQPPSVLHTQRCVTADRPDNIKG